MDLFFSTFRQHIIRQLQIAILILLSPYLLFAQTRVWSLQDCIKEAIDKNVALQQGINNNEINKISYTQSKANYYPNLNLTDQHDLNYGRSQNPLTGQYVKENLSENEPALNSTVTLYNGSKNFNLTREYELNWQAGNLDIEKMKNDLSLNVIAEYLQVVYEYEAVEIAQFQEDATAEQVEFTKKYVEAGNKLLSSLYQVQAQLAANKAAKVNAQNQLQLSKVALMQLMQMPVTNDFDVIKPDSSVMEPSPVLQTSLDIFSTAKNLLPDVKSARTKTDAAIMALKVTKTEVIPKLSLSGSLFSNYSNLSTMTSAYEQTETIGYLKSNPSENVVAPVTVYNYSNYPFLNQLKDNFSQSLVLNLSIPIFNNYLYKSDIKKAVINVKNARLNETLAENTLRQAIEQAYTDQLAAAKNYVASTEQLAFEEKYYTDLGKQLHQGMATMTDYLVGQNNYYGAVVARLQAKYEYIFKTKVLAFYTGSPLIN